MTFSRRFCQEMGGTDGKFEIVKKLGTFGVLFSKKNYLP
jgi:hypothetical protein